MHESDSIVDANQPKPALYAQIAATGAGADSKASAT